MEHMHFPKYRWSIVTWLVIPLILVWMATSYLVGVMRSPTWYTQASENQTAQIKAPTNLPPPAIPKFQWQGTGLVTLWFDDGWSSQYTQAYPMLEQEGVKGALAVPTRLIGYRAYMTWPQVRRLQSKGWEITSHTRTHNCGMYAASEKILDSELIGAAQDLRMMGLQYQNFVSPCGVNSPAMKKIVQQYYTSFRSSDPGFNTIPVTDSYHLMVQTMRRTVTLETVMYWIKQAEREHKWLIIMFHQVDDTNSEYAVSPTMFKNILSAIKQANLPIVLPTQVLEMEGADQYISPTPWTSNKIPTPTIAVQSRIHE